MLKANGINTYKWISLVLAMLMICTPVLSIPSRASAATTTGYYVDATNGNDANDGMTIGAAFKTIQAAATVAQSGDAVYVRAGVYRETVTPANSGVTIKNYNNESVTVSGADLVTGWTLDSTLGTGKNIYAADMNWDMYNGNGNIVFADGVLMQEATFPNIAVQDLLDSTKYNKVKTFTYGSTISSLVDAPGLGTKFPANTLNSGMLWVRTGNGYASFTAPITGNPTTSTININWPLLSAGYNPDTTSYYYITRNKAVLDVDTEWYKDVANGKLYFIAPGNVDPSTITVEAKKRINAFDLAGKTNITIDGIKLRAANLNFVNSSYNMVKNTIVDAPDYNLPAGMADLNGLTLGLNLNGDHNTIRDSEIRNLYGPGILVDGHDNSVINNYVHNVDFLHSYADAVKLSGYNHLVSHNTLTMSGRGLIGGSFSRSVIEYNDISYGMKLSKDGGAVYVVNVDMENTEFHHNVVHDIIGAGGSHGIYPDNSVHNAIFYDNITYNTSANGILINVPNEYQLFYNNSIHGPIGQFCNGSDVCDSIGSKFTNNIVSGAFGAGANNNDMIKARNIISAGTTHWTAPYSGTNPNPSLPSAYSLSNTSTGFEQGAMISGVTDGYVGNKPEIGAVETGGAPWKVGHDFANPPNPTFHLNPNIPYINMMKNAGFERENFEEWTVTAGTPSLFKQSAWDYKASSIVRFQNYAARLKAGDALQQTVSGLKPNTTYTLNAWGIIQGTVFQAEDYNSSSGTFSPTPYRGENCLCGNTAGAWVKYNGIDFGTGLYNSINFGAANRVTGGKIDVKLDSPTNSSIASYTLNATNDALSNSNWNYNKIDTPITTSVTGVHDVYLVFSNANEILLDNFRLSTTTANVDQAILGVKDFGGNEKTTTITDKSFNSTTRAKSIEFTTGPNNTSATIYASKPNGNYYAFVDGFGVAEKVSGPVYPTGYLYKDGLDDVFWENWTTGTGSALGTPKVNTTTFLEGSGSYEVNEDRDVIYKVFPTSYNKTASLQFYDDMATAKTAVARVDNNTWSDVNTMYGLGVMTGTSTANYSFKLGNASWAVSSVARSQGWHDLRWDYSSGQGLVMYIDNILVASTNAITGFNLIAMGDWTADSKASTAFFDDVRITEWADDEKPRLTLPSNLTVATTAPNAVVNFTVSAYDKKDGPLTVTTSVQSGSIFPIGLTTVNCSVTDSDNNTVTGSFIVNVESAVFLENFENGLSNWVKVYGTPSLSSTQARSGSNSYLVNEDQDALQQNFETPQNKVVSMWFYDTDTAKSWQIGAFVDDSVNARGIFVNTPTSTTKYSIRVGGTYTATSVTRTTGWHEFKFDYTSGTKLDMYIDGVLIASPTGVTSFNRIAIGDFWQSNNFTGYFDDISIKDLPTAPTQSNITAGNGKLTLNWTSVFGATGYKVKYGTASGVYTSTVPVGDVSSTTIEGLQNGTAYYFAISAYNSVGESRSSNEAIGTPDGIAPLEAVVSADITAPTNKNVNVTISYPDDAMVKEYKVGENGEWTAYGAPVVISENSTVYARGTDAAGNVSNETNYTVSNIDHIAPINATLAVDTTAPTNQGVTVMISYPADASLMEYKVGASGEWTAYTGPVVVSDNDTVYARGTDEVRNESNVTSITVSNIYKIAPVTTATLSPAAPNGTNSWYTTDVTVSLSVSASVYGGSVTTEYQVNGGEEWIVYTGSIPIFGDGTYEFGYRSKDQAGNVEGIKTVVFKVDKTAPALSVQLDKTSIWPANHKMVTINASLNSSDATSGVESVVLTSITSNQPDSGQGDIQANFGTAATSFSLRAEKSRIYTITYTATDKAGNKTVESVTVTVPHDQSGK